MSDDAALVKAAAAGDTSAFATLVQRHERRIYNLAYRMVGADDAADATQDAFLAAYRRLDSFRGDAAFSTWLYRIAVNACYDLLRTRARTPDPVEEVPEPDSARAPGASADPADVAGLAIDVQRALANVPEDFRVVLVLHDLQDRPYDEIAEITGVPLGTVKSRLHRGRSMLGASLGTSGAPTPSEGTL